jgi:hypothetical protein
MIGTQLWVAQGRSLSQDPFHPAETNGLAVICNKPIGGLWTSTYDPAIGSDWVRYLKTYRDASALDGYLIEMDPRARVYTIDTASDLERLMEAYPYDPDHVADLPREIRMLMRSFDFTKLRQDFDAVHLTKVGERQTRYGRPYRLDGWDCECTLWLKWCVKRAVWVGPHDYTARGRVQVVNS